MIVTSGGRANDAPRFKARRASRNPREGIGYGAEAGIIMDQPSTTHGGQRQGAGRKRGQLTGRRAQVLRYILEHQARGEVVLIGPMARVCGLADRRHAKRVMKDLRKWGYLPAELEY